MKALGLAFLSVFVLAMFAPDARAQEPSKPTYEKRVYKSDGNTYVQKSLPLYLKFSTSPGGENHALKSKIAPDYTDPMYLDTEGVNYIRSRWAVDPQTGKAVVPQQELMYEVYADGLPPFTGIRFHDAPRYAAGGKVYYGKGLNITLTSKDAVSGVVKTQYSLGGASYSDYSNTIGVNQEKADQTIHYYAADNVGNAEQTRSKTFTVDLTPPVTNHSIVGIQHNGTILAPSTRFDISRSDNLSGVNVTYYSYDSGGDKVYPGSPVSISYLSDGDHTLYYYARDNVKNVETKHSFAFYLDKIPPQVTATIVGDQYKGKYTYVSSRTQINLAATDNKAGVKNIYYRIDGGERVTYSSNFPIPNQRGVHTVKYDGMDNVQNLSANKYLPVFMDNVAPSTGIDYKTPQFYHRDTLFINKNTNITLFARDGESGVQKVEYSVDGGAYKPYEKFTIPGEGYHTITFKSTDRVNNVEQVKTSHCFVDNTAPRIHHHFSIEPIGQRKKGGKQLNIYPNYSRLYLGATDKHVGTERILYSINGAPLTDYSSPQTLDISELNRFKKKKHYEVRVVARDKLGNEVEEVIEFFIGRE